MGWDINYNNHLDYYNDSIPGLSKEINLLSSMVGVPNDTTSAIFIVPGPIWYHWLISFPIKRGDTIFNVNTSEFLKAGDIIFIGPWLFGSGTNEEWVRITHVDTTDNSVAIRSETYPYEGFKNDHNKYESFYCDTAINGLTKAGTSQSFIQGGALFPTHAHEICHQKKIGHLKDVLDKKNIMYFTSKTRTDTKLRYRGLTSYPETDSIQNQWNRIHN